MKLCKDCRFCDGSDCNHMNNLYTDPTTGKRNYTLAAINQRTLDHRLGEQCGPDGKWFEPKAPEILNCPEGHKAFVGLIQGGDNRVSCVKNGCWLAPSRPTKEEAIQVWNHMVKSLRNTPDE